MHGCVTTMTEADVQSRADSCDWSSSGHTIASVSSTVSPICSPPFFLTQQVDNVDVLAIPRESQYFMSGANQAGIVPMAKKWLRKNSTSSPSFYLWPSNHVHFIWRKFSSCHHHYSLITDFTLCLVPPWLNRRRSCDSLCELASPISVKFMKHIDIENWIPEALA